MTGPDGRVLGVTRRRPTAPAPPTATAPATANRGATSRRADDEGNYWRDDRVYESVFRFHGNTARMRKPLIEFRKTLPSGITMWSEQGPDRSVDIHMETNHERRLNLLNFSQMMVTKAWLASGCEVSRASICEFGLKQPDPSLHPTVHSPGAFLTD